MNLVGPLDRHARPTERIEWIALGAAFVPFVVAVIRAAVRHWIPVGDAAYFTVRSRDVFTGHSPLVGAWSSGSSVVGVAVNNLGPLQLDLLAPFTTFNPYLGTAVGSALINAGCVTIVWFVARRLLSPVLVVWVMAGTTLFVATLGLGWLIDARQQYAMVIPFFALLWVSAAMLAGVPSAVPTGLALASLVLQSHFTYAYQTLVVTGVGIVGFLVVTRNAARPRRRARLGLVGAAVLAGCWIQPALDQLFGTGNLGRVLGPARERQAGAGIGAGLQVIAGGSLVPPFWFPGSIGDFLQPYDGVNIGLALVAVLIWIAASVTVAALGWRTRQHAVLALGAAGAIALGGGVAAATLIPVSSFGLVPQNYYWVWSLGAFLTCGLLAGVSSVPAVRARLAGCSARIRRAVTFAVLAATVAVAAWPRYPIASVARDEAEAERIGRPLREQLADALASDVIDDTVEVDLSRAFFGNNYPFVMLVEMQRAGIEFRFPPENRNLDRFGRSRCAPSGEHQRILLIAGSGQELAPGSVVLAEVVGITDDELAEHVELQSRFGELLRAGVVAIDLHAITTALGEPVDKPAQVIDTPGMPATGLARSLDHWRSWGFVDVPSSERDAFDRWFELERRSSADFQTVVLEDPAEIPAGADGQSC